MRPQLDALIGSGWDQLYALMMIAGSISAGLGLAATYFLKFRLRTFFVTQADQAAFCDKLETEHKDNLARFKRLEDTTEQLATKHSLNEIIQRQESLGQQIGSLQTSHATLAGEIARVGDGVEGVKHIMGLVLDNLLQRDKS